MRIALAAAAIATALAALLWWPRGNDAQPVTAPAPIATRRAPDADRVAPAAPPSSLRDTEVDGALATDAQGRFAPTREAIALFDYFLSARGEEPDAQIRARIDAEIERRLPPEAAREARALLDRFLAFREEARRLAEDERIAGSADLERRLQWLRELRRKHFGAALAETLFGDEERAIEAALARRRVLADPALSDAERAARLDEIERTQPDSVRSAREAASLPARLAETERALRAAGGSDAEIRALRESTVGVEAADRLAALDERRAAWERRLADYRRARDAITEDAALAPEARDAAVETLRERLFDAPERIRVRALDAIEAGEAPPHAE